MLGQPRAVVFDELHFAKFASLYMQRVFFFDVHPPLGKLLLALAGGFSGFKGDAKFERIGAEYSESFPVYQLRFLPAVMGSMVVPLIYQIAVELNLSRWAALVAAVFIAVDNAVLVQSRFMLMEGMLMFFIIKYVGFFTALLIFMLAARDYWQMLADSSKSDISLVKELFSRVFFLVTIPFCLYISIFYVHLSILTKAGPHDNVMTSAFQASLEGGLATLTKGQPLNIAYGSQVTLRHTHSMYPSKPCWLHSHPHVYPIRYADGRGSSHQQQVTCYLFKDINNWWIIKDPKSSSMVVDEKPRPVKHGDIIQIVHGITSRALNSHDVAAPVTPQNQEVSCYIDYNISMPAQNLWRVEIVNRESEEDTWQTIKSHIRLIHVNTTQALKATGRQLPEWGFHQLEVATDRVTDQQVTIWNVEEHRFTRSEEKEAQFRDLAQSELIPMQPTHLSFWTKFAELQLKMFLAHGEIDMEHKYSSTPLEWPLASKNVAYWMSPSSNAQIHLIANPVVWISSTLSLIIYLALFVFYLMRRRRGFFDLTEGEYQHFLFVGELLVGGYCLHYLPFFLTDRTLFLHSYLPCVVYKVLAFATVMDHLSLVSHRFSYIPSLVTYFVSGLVLFAVWAFYRLSVFTYGSTDLKKEDIFSLSVA
ncbi:hypothetical protein FSP39_024538 [Pinctada imbricata]|uniref:dolichyl-phosphate-mannose--protein mannosyltransferase n=1 Tax=Pinctada imbricata TaxID=66713 RepID=A0AA89BVG5_PINIB|nr:hypothetical protein FSP39_024538 [Pinctada imbricata]